LQTKIDTQLEEINDDPLNDIKFSRLEILLKEMNDRVEILQKEIVDRDARDDRDAALFKKHPFTQEDYISRAEGSINEEAETRTLGRIQRGEFGEDFPRSGDSNYLSALSFAFLIDQVIENKSYDNFVINNPKYDDLYFSFYSEELYEKIRAICIDKTKIRNLGDAVKCYHLNEKMKIEILKSDAEMLKLPKETQSLAFLYNDYLFGVKHNAVRKRLLENVMQKQIIKTTLILILSFIAAIPAARFFRM
jgi:hypothetical protein